MLTYYWSSRTEGGWSEICQYYKSGYLDPASGMLFYISQYFGRRIKSGMCVLHLQNYLVYPSTSSVFVVDQKSGRLMDHFQGHFTDGSQVTWKFQAVSTWDCQGDLLCCLDIITQSSNTTLMKLHYRPPNTANWNGESTSPNTPSE